MITMRVQDIMTTTVRAIPADLDTAAARYTMKSARVRHLVVMEHDVVIGVVSQRDLGGTHEVAIPAGRVKDVMNRDVVVATPDTTVRAAANLLRGYNIGCLPVVDGNKLVGIVTTSDLLTLIGEPAKARRTREITPRAKHGARTARAPAARSSSPRSGAARSRPTPRSRAPAARPSSGR